MNSTNTDTPAGMFDKLLLLVGVIAAGAMVLAVFAVARGGEPAAEPISGAPAPTVQTARFELSEFAIDGDLQTAPGPTRFEVHNAGAIIHNLVLEGGPSTPDLSNGESVVIDVGDLAAGTYTIFCSISGHRGAGMEATLVVAEGAPPIGHQNDDDEIDWEALDDAMTQSILAFPAETEGKGNQLLEPEILPDGTKQYRLTAAITPWEVEPGEFVDTWTYNSQVPVPRSGWTSVTKSGSSSTTNSLWAPTSTGTVWRHPTTWMGWLRSLRI